MKSSLLLLLTLTALVAARSFHRVKDSKLLAGASSSSGKRLSTRETRETCEPRVEQYPVKGVKLHQANDVTNKMARSHYSKFSLEEYSVRNSNGRPKSSQFHVAIEHKTPKQELSSGNKQVKINFYNLLFTASLKIRLRKQDCKGNELSLLGFVELVKTDITWYRGIHNITEYRQQCDLALDNQYVMTKLIPGHFMFANNTIWSRATITKFDHDKMVPLKYESAEEFVVDFAKHRDTTQYEKLIEKKIFIVQIDINNEVLDVIAGVDVMMYLDLMTYNFTDAPHLVVKTNHSLIRRIADPQKYTSVINKIDATDIRKKPNCARNVPWSSITTINPIPKGVHIYTA